MRAIQEQHSQAGSHILTWDGLCQSGYPVPPGVCFCRLEAGGLRTVTRIVRWE